MSQAKENHPEFEKSLEELEKLVDKLESGELSLDESLDHFRRGVELTRECRKVLEQAQQTVEQLLDNDDDSKTTPFEPDN